MESATVSANGLEFAFFEAGSGPLALCLHGFPDTAWTFRHLLPRLAEAGFRAVAPFTRGYAPTQVPPDGAFQIGALGSDANALHEALGGDGDAVIIGHDWGAITTYGAAAIAPERWRRAVTLAVPPMPVAAASFFDYGQLKRSFYVFLFQTALAEGVVAMNDLDFIARLWADWSPGYDGAEDVARVKDALRAPENLASAIGYYRAMLSNTNHLERYSAEQAASSSVPPQPTLYLHGSTDGALGADVVRTAGDLFTGDSRFVLVEGVGHFLHLEKPDEVNALILDWVTTR